VIDLLYQVFVIDLLSSINILILQILAAELKNWFICLSSSNTCQSLTLFGMEGLCFTSAVKQWWGSKGSLQVLANVAKL
jgi:hypothetical protein